MTNTRLYNTLNMFTNQQRFEAHQTSKELMTVSYFASEFGIPLEMFQDDCKEVLVYYYGLYIEIVNRPDGKYYLMIDRTDYISNDLEHLEKLLFDFTLGDDITI